MLGCHGRDWLRLGGSGCALLMIAAYGQSASGATAANAGELRAAPGKGEGRAAPGRTLEVEGVVAAGETSGWTGFGCAAQQSRVRYVTGAGEVRYSERARDDPEGAGFTAVAGTALELGRERVLQQPQDESGSAPAAYGGEGPSTLWAAHARLGYYDSWFGAEGGAGVVLKWNEASAYDSWVLPFPDVRVSVGPRKVFYGFVGIGNSQPSSMALAVAYGGLGWPASPWLRLEGRCALDVAHLATFVRGDLTAFVRAAPRWAVRVGMNSAAPLGRDPSPPFEASLGFVFTPWLGARRLATAPASAEVDQSSSSGLGLRSQLHP